MTFVPGKSGNPGGRPKNKPWQDALKKAVARAESTGDNRKLDEIAWRLLGQALNGEGWAVQHIAERLDGKLPTPVVGDDEQDPISVRTIVTGVPRKGDAN